MIDIDLMCFGAEYFIESKVVLVLLPADLSLGESLQQW
jgi:hypothetical protein